VYCVQTHKIALECKDEDDGVEAAGNASSAEKTPKATPFRRQPSTDIALRQQQEEAYRKLIVSAYLLAVNGQPLTAFKTVVLSLKASDVKLIPGCDNVQMAKLFIAHLAHAVRVKVGSVLNGAAAFAVLCDVTSARKTYSEKQLVLVSVVVNGEPKYFTVALQNIDECGSASSENLKTATDDVFQKVVPVEQYPTKVVSVTADGAAVERGRVDDLLEQLAADGRPWLVGIPCIWHRVELAIKDCLLRQKPFRAAKDIMVSVFTVTRQSRNFQHHLRATARSLDVHVYKFRKVLGSRFISRQRKGLNVLLNNWTTLLVAIRTAAGDTSFKSIHAKLVGIHKQLSNEQFLAAAYLYKAILHILSQLSVKFEEDRLLPFDVQSAVNTATAQLNDLLHSGHSPTQLVDTTLLDNILQSKSPQPNHKNRKSAAVEFLPTRNPGDVGSTVLILKKAVIPEIVVCLQERFKSFGAGIFGTMRWLDPTNWRENEGEEIESIQILIEHFRVPLSLGGFDEDVGKLQSELKSLKRVVRHHYEGTPVIRLWKTILRFRRREFPNLCLLAEIILAIAVSSGYVESTFGFLAAMLSDRRLARSHGVMADLLTVRANHLTWSEAEREQLVEFALTEFMSTRRMKIKHDGGSQEPPEKLRVMEILHGNGPHSSDADSSSSEADDSSMTSETDGPMTA